jgi:hypothetical protein
MSIEAPPRSLNESLDYNDDDSHAARRAVAHALDELEEHLLAHLEYEERNVATTARRLRDLSLSSQIADSDLAAKEDHQ